MINITIVKIKQNITTIEATGHSGYAESGQDIVCAAVSTLLENLINGLTEIVKIQPSYVIDEGVPHVSVTLPKDLNESQMRDCQILMKSAYLGVKGVADGYQKFIKIKEKQHD